MLRLLLTLSFLGFAHISVAAERDCYGTKYDDSTHICDCTQFSERTDTCLRGNVVERPEQAEIRKKCDSAMTEVRDGLKRESDFRKACRKVTSKTDAQSCLEAANFCENCIGSSDESEDYCSDGDSDDDESDDSEGVNGIDIMERLRGTNRPGSRNNSRRTREIQVMKQRFKYCPIYSKDEFDKIVEEREKHEEEKKKGRELLEEKMAELKKAQRELGDLQKEQAKIPEEYTEEFNKIVGEEDQKLQDELERTGDQLVELILNLQTAEMQFIDAKNAIYKVCHDRAQTALDRIKADRREKISRGQLRSRNGFTGLARNISIDAKLEKYANDLYNKCKEKNKEVRNQIRSAERVYDQTIKRLNIQKRKLESQLQSISNQLIDSVENPKEKERLEQLRKTFEERTDEIGKQIAEKMEQVENLATVIERIQDELQANETNYAHYLEQEQIIRDAGAPSEDSGSRQDFLNNIEAFEAAVFQAYKSCDCRTGGNENCDTIQRYMDDTLGDGNSGSSDAHFNINRSGRNRGSSTGSGSQ